MAKKKLSRDQKRKQKKQKKRRTTKVDPFARMIRRMQGAGLGDHKFVRNPAGMEKMSDVLSEFIDPYKEIADTTDAMHKLLSMALVAWNAALLPESERKDSLRTISQSLPAEAVEDFYAIVGEMIERKNKYFAQHTRNILDYQLTDMGDTFHLSVVSTMGDVEI